MIFDSVSRMESGILPMETFCELVSKHGEAAGPSVEPGAAALTFPRPLPTLKQAADILIEEALKEAGGNKSVAARTLGITPQALGQRLKRSQQK